MSLHSADDIGLHLVLHALAAEVAIESTSSATESILFVLVIVLFELVNDSCSHMGMILAWAECGYHD